MKPLVSLLLLVFSASAEPTQAIRRVWLNPLEVVRVFVARDRLTTIRFPSPISDLEGAFLSPEPEPPAVFQISFRPGSASFGLRALVAGATATVTVGWKGNSYILELVESAEPTLAVIFLPMPALIPLEPARPAAPAALREMLKTAKLFEQMHAQQPDLLRGVERLNLQRRTDFAGGDIVLEDVFRFDAPDTLVLHATLHNRTVAPISLRPDSIAVRVGERVFQPALADVPDSIPACGNARAFVVLSAGINRTPPGISPNNPFQITFQSLGPVSRIRCDRLAPSTVKRARSPRDERP